MPSGVYTRRKPKSRKNSDHANRVRAGLKARRIEEAMDALAITGAKRLDAEREYQQAREALHKAMEG